jgi:membrane fusion protein (multidrug efflux system)
MGQNSDSNNHKKRLTVLGVFGVIAILFVIAIFSYMRFKSTHISTDDAFVKGNTYSVSSKIPGTVIKVLVAENQRVNKGDLVAEIDSTDYAVKLDQASTALDAEKTRVERINANIETAKVQLDAARAQSAAARANYEVARANLKQIEQDFRRFETLHAQQAISRERYEKAQTALDVAKAQVKAAEEQLKQAETGVRVQQEIVKQTEAERNIQKEIIRKQQAGLREARLLVSYTRIYAPADGYVTKKSVQPGDQVQAGQPLMSIVSLDDIWIEANYKETQVAKIRPGQKVRIKVDAYPGRIFSGTVESIMAGTGSVFSLFPPENATGNYVKVVQRIPVKITLDKGTDPNHLLRLGMSVIPTVLAIQ